jgi:3'-phosphoadenosine 5'-phosphosulfate sulfotransferase (PAPS reductase)/FAD synthetase
VYQLRHLQELESEAIYVIREVAAQFERPALLFSGGKDSIVLVHLAQKAFWPARIPFPLVHIDTGHNFEETLKFRDELVEKFHARLIVGSVQESIDTGRAVEEQGYNASRNVLQTITLLDTIEKYKFDAAIGGGRRDEEKARAKERFFSHRDEFGVRSSGTSSTARKGWGNISGHSPSATGRRWTSGSISFMKKLTCRASIIRMNGKSSTATGYGLPGHPS